MSASEYSVIKSDVIKRFDCIFFFSILIYGGKHTRFEYLSQQRAAKAQTSLRICLDLPELMLLASTKYGYK